MNGTSKFRARLAGGVGLLALCTGAAFAQSADFSLPAQPLSDSLQSVGRQTGQNILFTPQAVSGLRAQPLKGHLSAREAVNTLIHGTNLQVEGDANNGLLIRTAALTDAAPRHIMTQASVTNDAPASSGVEQVVVSGSRIAISGYTQPTPVTVLDTATLERDANVNVGDSIRQLPALGASGSPNNNVGGSNVATANAGSDLVNMRNLGFPRTLVLVDGQRVVASNITGGVDLSTIPTSVLQRVDVVTGGASAAWGSDAVAGVVNLVLNKTFTGFKANAEAGISTYGDHVQGKLEATYGTAFDGDRGHIVVSGQYTTSPDLVYPGSRQWFHNTQLVNNPAYTATNGQPKLIHSSDVHLSTANQGGIITSGPAANTTFGPGGSVLTFNPGVSGGGSYCTGCNGGQDPGNTRDLLIPYRSSTLFAYGSYQLTDDIKASLQLNYGNISNVHNSTTYTRTALSLNSSNPYLPASVAAKMVPNTTFTFNTLNSNNINPTNPSLSDMQNSLGWPVNSNHRQLFRGVFSLEGKLGDDWSWNAFWQHSNARVMEHILHNQIIANYNNAIQAVTVTPAQAATSGLAAGSIACASTITNPTNGCSPLNVFGTGVASQAAINYIDTDRNFQLQNLNQDELSVSLQGVLPFGLSAGRIAVAMGGEHRRETVRTFTDAAATAAALAQTTTYNVGNFVPQLGVINVDEGFLEADVPVLKDNIVQSLDFNAAGRITNYSTSGLVETWKMGATSQVNDDVKLRTSWSFDIRAPTLNDLFAQGTQTSVSSLTDPRTGKAVTPFQAAVGNPTLKPETSTTISGGVVLTPHWIPGLSLSADWYSINIKNAITTTLALTEVNQCAGGVKYFCDQLVYNGAVLPGTTLPSLSKILVSPVNAAAVTTSGLDFQADYTMPLYDGDLDLKVLGNYMDEQTQTALGIKTDYAGALSDDSVVNLGVPKFKMTANATYNWGPWSGTIQERVIGSAHLVNQSTGGIAATTVLPTDIDNNSVPAVAYMDLRASYNWDDNIKIYGAIDNLWNAPPPTVPDGPNSSQMVLATRADVYDTIGRMFRIGVRFNQ
jgi:iron complex outermembrane receptor protein